MCDSREEKQVLFDKLGEVLSCIDDEIISYDVTKNFVDNIKNNGGIAYLRTFPYGGHEPQLVGENVKNPCGKTVFNGCEIEIKPAVEETFIWIRNFS